MTIRCNGNIDFHKSGSSPVILYVWLIENRSWWINNYSRHICGCKSLVLHFHVSSYPRNASTAASSKMSLEFDGLLATGSSQPPCGWWFWWALSSPPQASGTEDGFNQTRLKRGEERERDIIWNSHDISCHFIWAGNERWKTSCSSPERVNSGIQCIRRAAAFA